MREIDRVRNYDKFQDAEFASKVEAYPPPVEESGTPEHQGVSQRESGSRTLKPVVGLGLRVLWLVLTKFFPWLGWLSVVVYFIIDWLSKH